MAMPGENKLQEFQNARDAITSGIEALAPSTPQEALQHVFAIASQQGEHRAQTGLVQQVREGTLDFDQLSIRVDGAAAIMLRNNLQKAKQAQADKTRHLLAMLDDLYAGIHILGERIADHEAAFEAEYGSDWREDMALELLDPDDMPHRLPGESIDDYQDRLEQALEDELLDDDGNIKPEYQDHPEYGRWAEWARDRYDHRMASDFVERVSRPGITEAEVVEKTAQFEQDATYNRIWAARSDSSTYVGATADNVTAEVSSQYVDDMLDSVDVSAPIPGWPD